MLGSLGFPEIIFILVLALLVFGPKRLPQVGRSLGRALGEFRRATTDLKRSFDRELTADIAPNRVDSTVSSSDQQVATGAEPAEEGESGPEPTESSE